MIGMPAGSLLCVGLRGATPQDPLFRADLEACAQAGVGAVILFDVDVPTLRRHERAGLATGQARDLAPRNIRDPEQLKTLIDHVRGRLGPEVLVAIDQEGGRVARLSPRHGFPPTPTAADFAVLPLREQTAAAIAQAELLRSMGIDLNFAPCVDLALEPANAVIAGLQRSFGSRPEQVVAAAQVVLDAHLEAGVASCLKHFPGHGSSKGDTHLGAVDITDTWRRAAELAPYHALAGRPGVAVMAAHVRHRGLDPELPASLSARVIGDLLRGEIGFDGLVVTDSLDMGAIAGHWSPAEAAVAAIDAGADLVIDAFNLDDRQEHPAPRIAAALQAGLTEDRIETSRRRIARLRREIGR